MAELPYHEEILDLVNNKDEVIGTITHDKVFDWANLNGNFLRASNGFVVNSQGQIWVPRRAVTKTVKPNGLDYSASEHVMSGETYDDAMVRGFDEELNMRITKSDLNFIHTLQPNPGKLPYFEAFYIVFSDTVPTHNADDFSAYEWVAPKDLANKIALHPWPSKENLDRAANLVIGYLAQSGSK